MFKYLIITHGSIGESLLECVEKNLQKSVNSIDIISLNPTNINKSISNLKEYISKHSDHDLIIMTDLYGASSSNIVKPYTKNKNIYAISGLNLPMLMKAVTFKTDDVQIMIDEIIKCGNKSIINFL